MRKSTLFISAVLTTFVLAMLAGVASAYQNLVLNDPVEAVAQQQQPQVQDVAQSLPAAEQVAAESVNLTPQEAAAFAAEVMGRDDMYSIEVTELNGETVYLVTFTTGELLYISMDGQIRSIDQVEVKTVVVNVSSGGGGGGGGDAGGGDATVSQPDNSSSNKDRGEDDHKENEDHDEHEDREEHDD